MPSWIRWQRQRSGNHISCVERPYCHRVVFTISCLSIAAVLCACLFCGRLFAAETRLENRNPSMGKVHVQNHAQVDKAPFFFLKPFRLMVLSEKRPVAIFCFDIILETHSEESKKLLEKQLPRIYSALLEDFYGLGFLLWGTGYHTSSMSLKKRAERVISRIVREDLLRDVMVQKVLLKSIPKTSRT